MSVSSDLASRLNMRTVRGSKAVVTAAMTERGYCTVTKHVIFIISVKTSTDPLSSLLRVSSRSKNTDSTSI
jgi:hypothetical protein